MHAKKKKKGKTVSDRKGEKGQNRGAERRKTEKDWGGITEPGKNPGKRTKKPGEHEKRLGEKQNQGKILVHQPAAPRAFTTLVFVLNGEDWTEKN
jgi:hypothetical protein